VCYVERRNRFARPGLELVVTCHQNLDASKLESRWSDRGIGCLGVVANQHPLRIAFN